MAAPDTRQLGAAGEEIACRYLLDHGFHILDRNVRYKCGELDIIALDTDDTVVFCEVKARSTAAFGGAEAVDSRKLGRLRRAASQWLAGRNFVPVRFDVIELIGAGPGYAIEHYEGVDDAAR